MGFGCSCCFQVQRPEPVSHCEKKKSQEDDNKPVGKRNVAKKRCGVANLRPVTSASSLSQPDDGNLRLVSSHRTWDLEIKSALSSCGVLFSAPSAGLAFVQSKNFSRRSGRPPLSVPVVLVVPAANLLDIFGRSGSRGRRTADIVAAQVLLRLSRSPSSSLITGVVQVESARPAKPPL